MRKEYRQAVRQLMTKGLADRFPDFVPSREKSPYLWPGEILYMWQARPDLRIYVVVSPDIKAQRDAFSVHIAWSRHNRFPQVSPRPWPEGPSPDGAELDLDECEIDLIDLCQPPGKWWSLPIRSMAATDDPVEWLREEVRPISREEARARISPLVTDAIEALERFGMPYVNKLLERMA